MPPDLACATMRTFIPAKDFAQSNAFYVALGFPKVTDGEVAIFDIGTGGGIIVQDYYVKEWAENVMLSLAVDDLDAWWAHVSALDLAARFGVQPPRPPARQAWGLVVAYLFDPAGVLWHVIARE